MFLKKIKNQTIYTLKKIKLFYLIYFFLISWRRFFFKKKKINFKKSYDVVGKKNYDFFLGYYDVNNFSFDEKKILFHQKHKDNNFVSISLYDLENKITTKYDNTLTWSWQLGSRTQWISDRNFIFNTLNHQNKIVSKSIDFKNKVTKIYPFSIFSLSSNFKYALSLNFNKLEKCRPGYGYLYSQNEFDDNENYIFIWNIQSQKIEYFFGKEFFKKKIQFFFEEYYFNHASWSLNNKDFIVYAIDKYSRKNKLLYFKNFENLEIINDIEIISHHEWISENEIFFYGKIGNENSFFRFNLVSKYFKKINFEFSSKDGHPHSSDGNLFVIDTYPNKFQERNLYTYNLSLNKINFLGSAYNNFYLTNERKCDFHPKISKNNKTILFDSSHNLNREFIILEN